MPLVEVTRELTDGHAVTDGQGVEADEGCKRRIRHVALDERAAERIGPIKDDDTSAVPRARAHGERHGPDERVVAGADVLQVHDDRIDSAEHRGGRLAPRAVEAPYGQARHRVARAVDPDVVLGRAPQSVLRR